MRTGLSLTLSLLLAACGAGDRARTALSDTSGVAAIEPGSVAGAMTIQLWELRDNVSLGQWKAAHPDEPISGGDSAAVGAWLGEWCAAAQKTLAVGNRVVIRTAFFYPPEPTDLAIPDSTPDLVRSCLLGAIWVHAEVPDTGSPLAVSDSVRAQFRRLYGPPVPRPVRMAGTALWEHFQRFHRGHLDVATAVRRTQAQPGPGSRAVISLGILPASGLSLDSTAGPYAPPDTMPLDSAAALAGIDSALYLPLRRLTASVPLRPASSLTSGELTTPLRRWIQAADALPPARGAAALYIADRILDATMCTFRLCDDDGAKGRAALEALGAHFVRQNDIWVSQHAWLIQARALDRDSPIGQRILLAQLGNAFDFSGSCAGGPEEFRRVIAEGERYLARMPATPIAPSVHFLVGEAWRDIVALAHGAGGLDADSSRYGAEAEAAAQKALAHYTEAMKAGPTSPVARAAWRRAWWLRAGLAPRGLRFYCVGD